MDQRSSLPRPMWNFLVTAFFALAYAYYLRVLGDWGSRDTWIATGFTVFIVGWRTWSVLVVFSVLNKDMEYKSWEKTRKKDHARSLLTWNYLMIVAFFVAILWGTWDEVLFPILMAFFALAWLFIFIEFASISNWSWERWRRGYLDLDL